MNNLQNRKKGFTLIELLVVIAIIGLLSSIVLASLASAKNKAKDVAVIQSLKEFSKLMELEYQESGNYANLTYCAWVPQGVSNCNGMFAGKYAQQARDICNNIVNNATPIWGDPGYKFLNCVVNGNTTKFSLMAVLSNGSFTCLSNNNFTQNTNYWLSRIDNTDVQGQPSRWEETSPGCHYNP